MIQYVLYLSADSYVKGLCGFVTVWKVSKHKNVRVARFDFINHFGLAVLPRLLIISHVWPYYSVKLFENPTCIANIKVGSYLLLLSNI